MTIMIQGRDNWWRGEFWNNFTVFFFFPGFPWYHIDTTPKLYF